MLRGRCGNDIRLTAPPKSFLQSHLVDLERPQVSLPGGRGVDAGPHAGSSLRPVAATPGGSTRLFLPSTIEPPSTVLPLLSASAGSLPGGASLGSSRGSGFTGGLLDRFRLAQSIQFGLPPGAIANTNTGGSLHGSVPVHGNPTGPDFPLGGWPGSNPYGNGGFPGETVPSLPDRNFPQPRTCHVLAGSDWRCLNGALGWKRASKTLSGLLSACSLNGRRRQNSAAELFDLTRFHVIGIAR
jgi:hypothetical protein